MSEGCRFCYAEKLSHRNPGVLGIWGDSGTRVVASEAAWREPLKWDRAAKAAGERHRVFCASLADVFEDWDGEVLASDGTAHYTADDRSFWMASSHFRGANTDDMHCTRLADIREKLFVLINATPHLDWLLLTKRPENIRRFCGGDGVPGFWAESMPPNVWIGTSVENQATADERIPHLLRVPAKVRFLSCEPLLGPVDLTRLGNGGGETYNALTAEVTTSHPGQRNTFRTSDTDPISWVIVGGESGHGARPMHPDWVESIRDQCVASGTPYFFKQWGEWGLEDPRHRTETYAMANDGTLYRMADLAYPDGAKLGEAMRAHHDCAHLHTVYRVGKKAAGRMLDGRTWDQFPEVVLT